MTQSQLDHAVARATSETLHLVQGRGFGLLGARTREDRDAGGRRPRIARHSCGRPVADPGGSGALAECLDCDLYFEPASRGARP